MIYILVAIGIVFGADMLLKALSVLKQKIIKQKKPISFFEHEYLESKGFYAYLFNKVPVISYIGAVDPAQVFAYVKETMGNEIVNIYQHLSYNRENERQEFSKTFFELQNGMLVEIGSTYAEVLYGTNRYEDAQRLIAAFSGMKLPEKKQDFEINIITQTSYGLELKALPIAPTDLDIALYYNDDFAAVDELVQQRLNQNKDKGIVLLHGLPGTGKTTYLRYLIGKLNKRVLFMSPAIAGSLTNPEFVELLLDNPNCVLVIEDAEQIIMDRKINSHSAVANLLNIGDGLLSDCLSVQIICTFNSVLASVDAALMRKGRLIARYEFGKLGINKAQALSNHLGHNILVNEPMTLAEITNPGGNNEQAAHVERIGFKQHALAVN